MKNLIKIIMIALLVFGIEACVNTEQPTKILVDEWKEITDTVSLDTHQCFTFPYAWWKDSIFVWDTAYSNPFNFSFYKNINYFINDTETYYRELLNPDFPDCTISSLNLDSLTLIGMFCRGRGFAPKVTKKITINQAIKMIKYEIIVEQQDGIDVDGYKSMNWMLIPKISNDYQVQYIRKLIRWN
jgi:hypothetical protein